MLRNYSVSQSGKYWIWSMFYSLLFLFVYGYKFNCSDLEEHLPAVYKMLNPHLYQGDYVTEFLASNFSVRYFYNHTLYYPGLVFSLSTVAFTLMLMLLTVFTYYIQKTSFVIFKNHITASITPFIAIILLNKITIGGNTVSDNMLTCTVFANTLCMAAFYYGLSSRLRIAALCCGLATWYQPLIGLQVFLLLMLMHSVINKFRLKEIGITITFYFLSASPMLLPLFNRQFFAESATPDMLFYYVLYVFRNPHHYLPSFFPVADYIKSGILFLISGLLFFRFPTKYNRQIMVIISGIVAGMIFYYLIFDAGGMMIVGKLQWYKTSVWFTFFCSFYIAHFIAQQNLIQKILQFKCVTASIITLSIVIFYLITHASLLPLEKLKTRYTIGQFKKTDLMLMHEWIRENTPVTTKILSFPDDDSFLCEAQRPTPVAWKAIIHEPWFLKSWYYTFTTDFNLDRKIEWKNINQREKASVAFLNINHKPADASYTMILLNANKLPEQGKGKIIHRQGEYTLWQWN